MGKERRKRSKKKQNWFKMAEREGEEELDDRADTIQWWLYEHVQKCIWYDFQDGRRMRYDMPTAESLYDYLTLPFEQLPLISILKSDNI